MKPADLASLNPNQRAAALCVEGPLLVLAGAGSGKTRVITHRIAHMLDQGIAPDSIVALSFTNKAADEMRERLEKMVGRERASSLVLGTFHSLGVRMMRARPQDFGVPQRISILDQGDVLGLVRSLLRDEGFHGHGSARRFDPAAIAERISLWKNEFITPDEARDPRRHDSEYDEIAAAIYGPYEERLEGLGAVDFDDLVCRIARGLERSDEARAYWQDRFRYLLVDEYQDTNRAQLEVLRALAGEAENLCVVGDDDQAIYGWRGARVANILGFDLLFPRARVIKLEENYRSLAPVLECANGVIRHNRGRLDKVLIPQRTSTARGVDGVVTEVIAEDDLQEARWVGDRIYKLQREEGFGLGEIAVLYRSARQVTGVEERLQEHGFPYRVLGGQAMYDKKQVKDALAYLKVLVAPRDELAVRRALDVPSRGIGSKSVQRLCAFAAARGGTLVDAVHHADEISDLPSRAARGLSRFSELVRAAQARRHATGSVAGALRELLAGVELQDHLVKETGSLEAATRRWGEVERLIAAVDRFEERAREAGKRPRWSELLAVMSQDNRDDGEQEVKKGQVTLATLHSAKGLEWRVVFILGCEEGLMPHRRVEGARISDAIAGDIEEERRLFYVGITRARDRLFLTRAAARLERGRKVERAPSRFMRELPAGGHATYEIAREEALTGAALQSMADAFLARLGDRDHVASGA